MLTTAMLLLKSSLFLSLHLAGNVNSFPKPLTAEEERVYLARSVQGDLEARNVLVERNMRLVAHIIKKYYVSATDQDDLISIGTIGLIKGISSYKPEKNVRLATYAARCIENSILSPRKIAEAQLLNVKYKSYAEINNVPDRMGFAKKTCHAHRNLPSKPW